MQQRLSDSSRRDSSLSHLFLVWFLVGSSFFGLGWDVADAVPVSVPLSLMGAGLLFGTVVVALLWIAGFRPSLSASGGYFIAEMSFHFLLVLGGNFVRSSGATAPPWQEIALRCLSIALAAALVFTRSGRHARHFLWKRGRKFVETPPEGNR